MILARSDDGATLLHLAAGTFDYVLLTLKLTAL